MRKLVLTAIAGSICAVFGSAYADSTVGNNDTIRLAQGSISGPKPVPENSEKGVQTPRSVPDNRPDAISKGETGRATGPGAARRTGSPMETERAPPPQSRAQGKRLI